MGGTFVGNSYPTKTSLFCQNHPMYTETTETYKYSRNLVAGILIFFFLWVEFKSTLKHECCIAAKVLFQIVVIVIQRGDNARVLNQFLFSCNKHVKQVLLAFLGLSTKYIHAMSTSNVKNISETWSSISFINLVDK